MTHKASADGLLPPWMKDLRISANENDLYLLAATLCGIDVHHWARHVLNQAAHALLQQAVTAHARRAGNQGDDMA